MTRSVLDCGSPLPLFEQMTGAFLSSFLSFESCPPLTRPGHTRPHINSVTAARTFSPQAPISKPIIFRARPVYVFYIAVC